MPSFEPATETVFTWAGPPLKFGLGAIEELGHDVADLGVQRCLLLTDPRVAATGVPERIRQVVKDAGLTVELYDHVGVEPTDESVAAAVAAAKEGAWDGFIAVGGGSVIDTAKAVNLLTTHPGELLDYISTPIGKGRPLTGPVKPLVAVPTTAGTGSESTSICVVDLLAMHLKAGISHPRLRPALAVVDPRVTITLPPEVTAASGMDVLSHAAESYTARSFDTRPPFASPEQRTAFCGANPVSDLWCERAMELVGLSLRAAVANGHDLAARYNMALASTYAGIGFGNAGTHIPHANSYPIAGSAKGYQAEGYPPMPMVPHGQAVSATAPAAFRFTYRASPARHLRAAELIAGRRDPRWDNDPVEALPGVLLELMRDIDIPLGIGAFGFRDSDIDTLVDGTMKQSRQLSVVPRPLTPQGAAAIFRQSL